MRPVLIAILIPLLLVSFPLRSQALACLQQQAQGWLDEAGVPGVSVAMRSASGERMAVAVGEDGPGSGTPLDTGQRLRIASLSKPLTAMGVLALVDAGRLELEAPVFGARGVLGGRWADVDRLRWIERMTVRHLLEHGGSLGGWDLDPMFVLGDDASGSGDLIAEALSRYPLMGRPGREFRYANLGYLILGEVIEASSGRPYEEHVREAILTPAGAAGMRVGRNGVDGRLEDEAGYAGEAAYATVRPARFGPFGGWVATPSELLDVLAWLEAGEPPGLADGTRLRMLRASAPRRPGGGASGYGLGWEVDRNGHGHFGAMPGTQAVMRQRRSGVAWVAIANGLPEGDPEGLRLEAMLARAAERCLP